MVAHLFLVQRGETRTSDIKVTRKILISDELYGCSSLKQTMLEHKFSQLI